VLLRLVRGKDEIDAGLRSDVFEAFERLADRLRMTVRDDGRSADRLS
jgi:hypothetical protein